MALDPTRYTRSAGWYKNHWHCECIVFDECLNVYYFAASLPHSLSRSPVCAVPFAGVQRVCINLNIFSVVNISMPQEIDEIAAHMHVCR